MTDSNPRLMIPSGIGPVIRFNDRSSSVRVAIWENSLLNAAQIVLGQIDVVQRRCIPQPRPDPGEIVHREVETVEEIETADHTGHRPTELCSP